ncbi:MAG: hypothetical protein ACOH19_07095 [Rhodoglobus sp.]
MTARIGAIVMAALLGLYLIFVSQYAILLINSEEPAAKAMGFALAVLPLVGAWVLIADLTFVSRGHRLIALLGAEGGLPVDDLPRLPSGRIDPKAADLQFETHQKDVEEHPDSWQSWLRLGLAYDASGDRSRARWATRKAIALHRAEAKATGSAA